MELEYYRQYEPIFGEYTIKKELGEGSSGKVFEIERSDIAGTFSAALKAITIPKSQSQIDMVSAQQKNPSAYYRSLALELQTEVELMAELKGHTNIVSYENHKFIQHDDGIGWDILIQMEILTPLYRYANVHEITEEDVIRLGIDMCSALELCHKHNIIHRDVKPENVFVTLDGDFKLGDFGIAKVFEETRSGTRIGTDSFMAPEVFNYRKYGTSVDIYSLGMVMYTLLNDHRLPFEEKSSTSTRGRRLQANNRRMMGEKIPAPANAGKIISDVVLKALEYKVEDRFSTAREMKEALLKAEAGVGIYDDVDRERKKTVSRKLAACILALLVAVGGIFAAIPKEISDITGIEDEVTILYGESLAPSYVIEPDRFADEKLSFKTIEDKVAAVDEDGVITAGKVGETELLISAMDFEKKVKVAVEPKVTKISGLKKKYTLEEGDSVSLKPELSPEEYSDEKIVYSVEDESIATVSKSGKVRGKDKGSTKVTVSAGGISRTVSIKVEEKKEVVTKKVETVYIPEKTVENTDNELTWGE